MWDLLLRIISLECLVHSLIMAVDIHTTYKMGKTRYGRMSHREFCPAATYVVGFRLQVLPRQGIFKDDSALNGIQLKCADGSYTGKLTGPHGSWGTYRQCTGDRHVTGFNLRSEAYQDVKDDAGATDVEMQCSDRKERLLGDGLRWGTWELPVGYQECPKDSYFCGVQARIEHRFRDATGVNEMIFICCDTVKGGWGEWAPWSQCSSTCNAGIQKRIRHCDNPKPMNEDNLCKVNGTRNRIEEQSKMCNDSPCPIDGSWSIWTSWTECTVTCGNGTSMRIRHCNNPIPAHKGLKCIMGNGKTSTVEKEGRKCSEAPCALITTKEPTATTFPPLGQLRKKDGSNTVVLAGASTQKKMVSHSTVIIVALVVSVVVLVLLLFLLWRRRRHKRRNDNRLIEMDDQAINMLTQHDHDDRTRFRYNEMLNLHDNSLEESLREDMNLNDPCATADPCHQNMGTKHSLPIYADIPWLESQKFTDLPPSYEDIPKNNHQSDAAPVYQNPQPIRSHESTTNDNRCYAEPGYHELNDRYPQQIRSNNQMPGYDSLGNHSKQRGSQSVNEEQVYDELNMVDPGSPINSQQQGYDHLNVNSSDVCSSASTQELMLDNDRTLHYETTYESMTESENIYESLNDQDERNSVQL